MPDSAWEQNMSPHPTPDEKKTARDWEREVETTCHLCGGKGVPTQDYFTEDGDRHPVCETCIAVVQAISDSYDELFNPGTLN